MVAQLDQLIAKPYSIHSRQGLLVNMTSLQNHALNTGCRILYVEDDKASRNLLQRAIKMRQGLELCLAASLQEARELLGQRPDIILLDFHLPDGSGYDFLTYLQASPEYADIPVIAVSASAMSDEVSKGLEAGLEHYLTKPLDLNELFSVIDSLRP